MTWGRRKLNAKLAENQPSLLSFPVTSPFSSFSLRHGLQPPPPPSPVFSPSSPPQVAIKPSHVVVAPFLSLLCKTLLLYHRDPGSSSPSPSIGSCSPSISSNNHLTQKLLLFPKAARRVALFSATPTVPAVSFPSPLQDSAPSSSSCD